MSDQVVAGRPPGYWLNIQRILDTYKISPQQLEETLRAAANRVRTARVEAVLAKHGQNTLGAPISAQNLVELRSELLEALA